MEGVSGTMSLYSQKLGAVIPGPWGRGRTYPGSWKTLMYFHAITS